jgi:hypothetical protein
MVFEHWASPIRVEIIWGDFTTLAHFRFRIGVSIMDTFAGPARRRHDALQASSQGDIMLFASMSHKGRGGVPFQPSGKTTATIVIGSLSPKLESQVVLQLVDNMSMREGAKREGPFNTIDINPATGFMWVPTSQRQQVHNIAQDPSHMLDGIRPSSNNGVIDQALETTPRNG